MDIVSKIEVCSALAVPTAYAAFFMVATSIFRLLFLMRSASLLSSSDIFYSWRPLLHQLQRVSKPSPSYNRRTSATADQCSVLRNFLLKFLLFSLVLSKFLNKVIFIHVHWLLSLHNDFQIYCTIIFFIYNLTKSDRTRKHPFRHPYNGRRGGTSTKTFTTGRQVDYSPIIVTPHSTYSYLVLTCRKFCQPYTVPPKSIYSNFSS